MFLRFLLFALMGVGIIGFTGVAWMASHTTNDAVAAAPLVPATKIKVVTINRAVRAGTLLKSDDIGGRDIVADQLAPGYAEDTPEARRALIGSMVRASMVPGVGSYFVFPASNALIAASLINPGVSKSGSPAP